MIRMSAIGNSKFTYVDGLFIMAVLQSMEADMSSRELPEIFESFTEARKNGFLTMKNMKDDGKKVVGIFCTYTPKEVIHAAGAVCVSLCAAGEETIPEAEKVLPKGLCPLIKASYGFAITDKCPYMYFSDLIVGETTCDGKKKMYEYLGETKDVHVMQLPQTQEGDMSRLLWRSETEKLKTVLEERFQVTITEEDLKNSIRVYNEERSLMMELYGLMKLTPPPMSGFELHAILNGSNFTFDKNVQNANIRAMIDGLLEKHKAGACSIAESAPRILLTGCPSNGVADKVIKSLEDAGAVVVCFENCVGTKNMENLVDEEGDAISAIAERYLAIPCSVMTPNPGRLNNLKEYIKEYKVDGVVDMVLTGCHTFAAESNKVKAAAEEAGASYLYMETDYSVSNTAQAKIRLEAFVEMLGSK